MVCNEPSVLIVDDEQVVCDVLYEGLRNRGYQCAMALNGNEALTKLASRDFDIALVDIKLPGMSGMEVLGWIQSNHRNTAAIMVTAVNNIDTAVEAMKMGALDYIVKPFDLDRVYNSICTVLEAKAGLLGRIDFEVPLCVRDEEEYRETLQEYFNQMNAIVRGVKARLDLLFGHSNIVAQETIDIARQLDIPEKVIEMWAMARERHVSKGNEVIKSSLNKLERSPLAQIALGVSLKHLCELNATEFQN